MKISTADAAILHVRFDGRSFDLPYGDLDIGDSTNDTNIKQALASYLNVPASSMRSYVVDRHETGNMTIRPEAVFG